MPPISSYSTVMYAALLHIIEGIILLTSRAADGSVGMAALLRTIPDRRALAAALFGSAAGALVVIWRQTSLSPAAAVLLLAAQQALLLTTAIGAWLAVWHGSYADGVLRSSLFITTDQLPRGVFSLLHLTATYGIAAYLAQRPRHSP